ncbi:hypothetical protein DEI98_11655 [Curtobacterium sp. MCLR17_034]|nr:hypothetical protein DEI98_11655 [Curtobacterium sp. MCLR17_034]
MEHSIVSLLIGTMSRTILALALHSQRSGEVASGASVHQPAQYLHCSLMILTVRNRATFVHDQCVAGVDRCRSSKACRGVMILSNGQAREKLKFFCLRPLDANHCVLS